MRNSENLLRAIERDDGRFTSADFSNMTMSDEDFERLFSALKHNTSITSLSLLESGIREHHISELHDALAENTTVVDLEIQIYASYPDQTRKLIEEMKVHVAENASNLAQSQSKV